MSYVPNARKLKLQIDKDAETARDLHTLVDALPPGQVKQLLKNETCRAILEKYGVTEA